MSLPPRFLLTDENDNPPESWSEAARRVEQKTRAEFTKRLEKEGYVSLSQEAADLRQRDLPRANAKVRRLENQIKYYLAVERLCAHRAQEQGLGVPLSHWTPTRADTESEGWRLIHASERGWAGALGDTSGDEVVLEPPDTLLREEGVDPADVFEGRRLTFAASETWGEVLSDLRASRASFEPHVEEARREAQRLEFRLSVLDRVLEDVRAGRLEAEPIAPSSDEGRGTPEDERKETLRLTIQELETQNEATSFVRDICGAVGDKMGRSGDAIRSRLKDVIAPDLRRRYPELNIPDDERIKSWQASTSDLKKALQLWEGA